MYTIFYYNQDTTLERIKELLNIGFNINTQNDLGDTLLHYACEYKHYDIIQFLLSKNADINIKNEKGYTPFDIVIDREILILLYRKRYCDNKRQKFTLL